MSVPTTQQYKNPLKWGFYYVSEHGNPSTGLMSRREASKWRRRNRGGIGYGLTINYVESAPSFKPFRRIGFPLAALSRKKIPQS